MTRVSLAPPSWAALRRPLKRRQLRYLLGRLSPRLYYWLMYQRERRVFFRQLREDSISSKTSVDSLAAYEAYDDREQREHATAVDVCCFQQRIVRMPVRQMRDEYLKYLFSEIDPLLDSSRPLRVLEVGCGNGINLVALRERYGDRIQLHGLDTSPRRIEVARNYFGANCRTSNSVRLRSRSRPPGRIVRLTSCSACIVWNRLPITACRLCSKCTGWRGAKW